MSDLCGARFDSPQLCLPVMLSNSQKLDCQRLVYHDSLIVDIEVFNEAIKSYVHIQWPVDSLCWYLKQLLQLPSSVIILP